MNEKIHGRKNVLAQKFQYLRKILQRKICIDEEK